MKLGLACVAAFAGFLSAQLQAWGAGLVVSAPVPPPAHLTPPPVQLPAAHATLPPVQLPSVRLPPTPVQISPPIQLPLPSVHLAPAPVHLPSLVHPSRPLVQALPQPAPPVLSARVTIAEAQPARAITSTTTSALVHPTGNLLTRSSSITRPSSGTPTIGSATVTFGSGGPGAMSALWLSSGYGIGAEPNLPGETNSHSRRRVIRAERTRELLLIATVRRLHACLNNLPDQLQVVLELAAGVNTDRPLSPAEVAHHLHISVGRARRLEQQALKQLRLTARTHACTGTRQTTSQGLSLSGFGPVFGGGVATGGVKAARYAKAPSGRPSGLPSAGPSRGVESLLGVTAPPAADDTWLIALLALGGGLSIGFLFVDKERRTRWLRRPPR
jgi:hypothetical protein